MEVYLKNLLNESDSSGITIVDDNFNSSLSSLPQRRRKVNRNRRSVRRATSLNSKIIYQGFYANNYSPNYSPLTKNTDNNQNRTQLSARMERHRETRWNASSSSSSQESISSVARNQYQPSSISDTSLLQSNVRFRSVPDLAMNQPQRKAIADTANYNDNRVIRDCKGIASTLPRFCEDSETLSHQAVINKAIAISNGKPTNGRNTISNKTRTSFQRVKREDLLKMDQSITPPSVPVRRLSRDSDFQYSLTEITDGPRIQIPDLLLGLPYNTCSHSV